MEIGGALCDRGRTAHIHCHEGPNRQPQAFANQPAISNQRAFPHTPANPDARANPNTPSHRYSLAKLNTCPLAGMRMNISPIESRLAGTPTTRFFQELFGNSLYFPITNLILEMLVKGWRVFILMPDGYVILMCGVIQAIFLSRWQGWKRLPGNLIGPMLYIVTEVGLEGSRFFDSPNHLFYWVFALIFGLLQAPREYLKGFFFALLIILEDVFRASILIAMYYVFELKTNATQTVTLFAFFSDTSHQF
jgi:hypothetical protein